MKNKLTPYAVNKDYKTATAYFCMEFGVDQALHIYSGGLGYLAGSHLRAAYQLKQNFIGVGMLWSNGYYDQGMDDEGNMTVDFVPRKYEFLEDTGIILDLTVHHHPVKAKVMYLDPEVFKTAPLYLLTTDIPENDHLARTITHRLYDNNIETKMAQYIVLGSGGHQLMKKLGVEPEVYHLNEAHALPAAYAMLAETDDLEAVRDKIVFTTHTPIAAGNEIHDFRHLKSMSFFCGLSDEQIERYTVNDGYTFNQTLNALFLSRLSNGVSQMHGETARRMWQGYDDITPEIIAITNSQDEVYWADDAMYEAVEANDRDGYIKLKHARKKRLFDLIYSATGKRFRTDVLTIVWARRFATYKRADMITYELDRFKELMLDSKKPVQMIWSGKPYPGDHGAIEIWNRISHICNQYEHCVILPGYELELSRMLKAASDVWLNTPRVTREASGTSGMTAAMNGSVNMSTWDGWIPEFADHGKNAFVISASQTDIPTHQKDWLDMQTCYSVLLDEVLPTYYENPQKWWKIVRQSMEDVLPFFDSKRMADEYYKLMYILNGKNGRKKKKAKKKTAAS